MLTHYLVYVLLKLTLFITNIFLNIYEINDKVFHYDVWYIFLSCAISIMYGEYINDFTLKSINFAVLGLLLTAYFSGYYGKFMALLTTENLYYILNRIKNNLKDYFLSITL